MIANLKIRPVLVTRHGSPRCPSRVRCNGTIGSILIGARYYCAACAEILAPHRMTSLRLAAAR